MHWKRYLALALLWAALLSLSACVGGRSPPSQFYMLEPIRNPPSGKPGAHSGELIIGLAPVRIPQYIDRPQMVIAMDRNVYRLSDFDRWAERLDDNIARVLVQNLGMLVPADVVLLNTSNLAKQAQLRLVVNILEFHIDPQGQARLVAEWRAGRGEDAVVSRQSTYREPASTSDHQAMASALNACLDRFSRDMAEALRQLAPPGQGEPGRALN